VRAPLTVLYDADCGFCRYTLAALLRLDRRRRLLPATIQGPDGGRLLAHLTPEQRLASAHVVTPQGRVYSGGDVVVPIARELPGMGAVAVLARALAAPTRWGYRQIAGNRTKLGKLVSQERRDRATEAITSHRNRVLGQIR
jgi:predicted DCC family thiol-disulfide oxidoreductase YuxK